MCMVWNKNRILKFFKINFLYIFVFIGYEITMSLKITWILLYVYPGFKRLIVWLNLDLIHVVKLNYYTITIMIFWQIIYVYCASYTKKLWHRKAGLILTDNEDLTASLPKFWKFNPEVFPKVAQFVTVASGWPAIRSLLTVVLLIKNIQNFHT